MFVDLGKRFHGFKDFMSQVGHNMMSNKYILMADITQLAEELKKYQILIFSS